MTKPETAPVSDSTREKYKHVRFADVDLSVANDQCDACSCGCVGWLFNIFSMIRGVANVVLDFAVLPGLLADPLISNQLAYAFAAFTILDFLLAARGVLVGCSKFGRRYVHKIFFDPIASSLIKLSPAHFRYIAWLKSESSISDRIAFFVESKCDRWAWIDFFLVNVPQFVIVIVATAQRTRNAGTFGEPTSGAPAAFSRGDFALQTALIALKLAALCVSLGVLSASACLWCGARYVVVRRPLHKHCEAILVRRLAGLRREPDGDKTALDS